MVKLYTILSILSAAASISGLAIPENKELVAKLEVHDLPYPHKNGVILAPTKPYAGQNEEKSLSKREAHDRPYPHNHGVILAPIKPLAVHNDNQSLANKHDAEHNKLEKRTICDDIYEPAFYADAVEVVKRFKGYGAMKCSMGPNGCSQMFHHKSAGLVWCAEDGALAYCKDIGEAAEHILLHCTNGGLTGGFNELHVAGKTYGVRIVKTGALDEKKHHH